MYLCIDLYLLILQRVKALHWTASEVMKKLRIANSTLYHYVDTGKIKKVVPPGRKEGYYPKAEIDQMLRAQELFILQYATDTTLFEKAQEEDIEGITNLCIELFGKNGTANYETRLAQYKANPDIFYVLRQDELIVGYIGLYPLKHEAIETIMSGVEEANFRTNILAPQNIAPFEPGKSEEVFVVIGARQGVKHSTTYGMRLISGGLEVIENFARKGIIIKRLYATSRTQDGICIIKGSGFRQVNPAHEEDDLLRFEYDLEKSETPILKKYHRIVKRVTNKEETRQ